MLARDVIEVDPALRDEEHRVRRLFTLARDTATGLRAHEGERLAGKARGALHDLREGRGDREAVLRALAALEAWARRDEEARRGVLPEGEP